MSFPAITPGPLPIEGQALQNVLFGEDYDADDSRFFVESLDLANLITSIVEGSEPTMHKIVLDIDLPAKLIPSTTEGHFHLYIDKAMTEEQYMNILIALEAGGIIEEGYLRAAERRRYTAVRLPWIKKEPLAVVEIEDDGNDF